MLELLRENGFVGKEWVLIKKVSKEERQDIYFEKQIFFFFFEIDKNPNSIY